MAPPLELEPDCSLVGEPAPKLVLVDLDGERIALGPCVGCCCKSNGACNQNGSNPPKWCTGANAC